MQPALDELASRLQADLRIRFPDITTRFAPDSDGMWVLRVDDGNDSWGEISVGIDDLSGSAGERLLAQIAFEVADNLWPDQLTEPWPMCPRHGDHPLQVKLAQGRAAWVCLRDPDVVIPVGGLRGGLV